MPLFKVSVGSEVPVSAVVVSDAPTMPEAIAEVRLLQARARVNWRRTDTAIGAIEAPYEIWAQPGPNGSFIVSLAAKIPISSIEALIAEDAATAKQVIQDKQANGLINWTYRGVPVGDYRDPIPTFWVNQQPDLVTQTSLIIPVLTVYPGQSLSLSSDITAEETPVGNLEYRDTTTGSLIVSTAVEPDGVTKGLSHAQAVTILPAGSYNVGAFYLGSDGYQASASTTLAVTVEKISTDVFVSAPNPPIYAGQYVSLSAIVHHANTGAPNPSGIVTLFDGTTVIASTNVVAAGVAALGGFTLGTLPPGSYSFTVQYEGDNIHSGSVSSVVVVNVLQAPTTTTLAVTGALSGSDASQSGFGPITSSVYSQSVRLTARVQSGVPNTVPTGSVTFYDGATPLGTVTLGPAQGFTDDNADGIIDPSTDTSTAYLDVATLGVSVHSLSVQYSGNASFAASTSGSSSLTVNKAFTVINAFSTNTPTIFGQVAVYDATVVAVAPATKTPFQQYGTGGTVTYSGGVVVNFDASGHAGRSVSGLPVGTTPVTVQFNATAEYNASSVVFNHVTSKANTTVTTNSFTYNGIFDTGRMTVTVAPIAPGAGTPTGTVSLYVYDPIYFGNLFLGTGTLSGGVASIVFNWFPLVSSNYTYTAIYNGDTSFNTSQVAASYFSFGYFF